MSDDIASALIENEEAKQLRERVLQWDDKENPLAPITPDQQELCDRMEILLEKRYYDAADVPDREEDKIPIIEPKKIENLNSKVYDELHEEFKTNGITSTELFLHWYDKISEEKNDKSNDKYHKYMGELQSRSDECQEILDQIDTSLEKLYELEKQYEFVSNKTSSLNSASEQLQQEQKQLNGISEEIQRRLYYFNQAEHLSQRLQSPTLSVASDSFRECLNKIDECLDYLRQNPKFKESSSYLVKYKHCLARAVTLMKNYVAQVITQATEHILAPKQPSANLGDNSSSDAAFALYYGKFQTSAIKIKKISSMIEERIGQSPEYEQLLSEIHQNYLSERANIMSPAVEKAIKDLKSNNKGDHCSLIRSACAFLVHVCQDEHRLFFQFFTIASEQLNLYLEGLCTILYDNLRPYIIHINHLETLAEICSILRIEMLEEHVQQNPESLEAFGKTVFQLLQDVQERLVFRAHLYLQSDILNYNPSAGDLAYPDKLEMMENIALSIQESQLKRSDSRGSLVSGISSAIPDNESIVDNSSRGRFINSPADLHGMWYPTVRRTLVCLSRLYRCIDRPIFQGLSQEALKYCINSVSSAGAKISGNKSPIDGELFEIKHLLILREQIAPFRVDFTVKETSLDFSKVKTAAFGLLHKRKQLFSLNSNNAILEFLLDGTPQVKEQLLDSRKDVDRQLKATCERFIKDAVNMLVGPILQFLDKVQSVLTEKNAVLATTQAAQKLNLQLRQSQWASPQQISGYIQESQRLIKSKLSVLQRSMQLYLSNRDTEFIIFRPIRNNIISSFVKLEQILTSNGYTQDDMIITSCPSAEQVSILLSSASILADMTLTYSGPSGRKFSTSSNDGTRKISTSSNDGARKISTSSNDSARKISTSSNDGTVKNTGQVINNNKIGMEKKTSFDNSNSLVSGIQEEIV